MNLYVLNTKLKNVRKKRSGGEVNIQNIIVWKALEIKCKWHHVDSELAYFMYKVYPLKKCSGE